MNPVAWTSWHIARAALALGGSLALTCTPASAELPSARSLRRAFAATVEGGPGTVVSLDVLIPGEWRHLYVFGPYTPDSLIERCVGARVPDRGIARRDDINLLVLVPDRGPVRTRAVARDPDFGREAVGRGYPRGAAAFAVRRPDPGEWGELVPANGLTRACIATPDSTGATGA